MSYSLEEAQTLHEMGYSPVTAPEVHVGDRCAYQLGGYPTVYVTAQRIEHRTWTLGGIVHRGVMIWCEHSSGAVLVQEFGESCVMYIAPNVDLIEDLEG